MDISSAQVHTPARTTPEERTQLIYEDIPGCSPPPFFDLSTQTTLRSFESAGVVLNYWSEGLLRIALRLSGVESLQRDPSNVERLFRSVSLRNNHFAPVMSATTAISDHPSSIDPLNRAAALLLAARAMHQDLLSGRFRPDQYGGSNLEMGQYANLFSTHIIHDKGQFRLFKSTRTSQITVLIAGRAYSVDFGLSESMWTESELLKALNHVKALSAATTTPDSQIGFPVISAAKPGTQAELFTKFSKDPSAARSLGTLRHSFVTLCLDLDLAPSSAAEAAAFAHSGNVANRWYNSALQIVVFGNSKACLIFNFNAYLDGNIQARAASELWKRSTTANCEATLDAGGQAAVAQEIVIPMSRDLLDKARKDFTSVLHSEQSTFEVAGFGQSFFGSRGLDPVATFVVALQLGIFRLTGGTPRIGQLVTMSKFRYLDLVTAFVTTPEVKCFVESMQNEMANREQRRKLLQAAIDSQLAVCRNARECFPLFRLPTMMAESTRGVRRFYIKSIMKAANILLRIMRLTDHSQRDIIISHPRTYDEIPVFGRPGVRLPYVKCFGLHYQILGSSTVLTWMPALSWKTTNAEMTNAVTKALRDIEGIADIEGSAAKSSI